MRIVDSNASGQAAPTPNGRTGQVQSANLGTGASAKNGKSSAADTDRVELSSFTGRISQTLAADSASRAQRVAQLKNAVQSGTYKADAQAVSRALVDQAIAAGKSS